MRHRAGGSGESYTYDAGGSRLTRTHDGLTTSYFGLYEKDSNGTERWFYQFGGSVVAQRERTSAGSDTRVWLHGDHLGSVALVTGDASTHGNVISDTEYGPWGQVRPSSTGTKPTALDYTGQHRDGTGLVFLGSRYYDPVLGRFLSPDSVVDGVNPYSYTHNNPINHSDITGHCDDCKDASDWSGDTQQNIDPNVDSERSDWGGYNHEFNDPDPRGYTDGYAPGDPDRNEGNGNPLVNGIDGLAGPVNPDVREQSTIESLPEIIANDSQDQTDIVNHETQNSQFQSSTPTYGVNFLPLNNGIHDSVLAAVWEQLGGSSGDWLPRVQITSGGKSVEFDLLNLYNGHAFELKPLFGPEGLGPLAAPAALANSISAVGGVIPGSSIPIEPGNEDIVPGEINHPEGGTVLYWKDGPGALIWEPIDYVLVPARATVPENDLFPSQQKQGTEKPRPAPGTFVPVIVP